MLRIKFHSLAIVLGAVTTLCTFTSSAHAQYKLYWVRCSERPQQWRPFGLTPESYGVNPSNYNAMAALAQRLSSANEKYAVGTANTRPTSNPCGGANPPGGGGGGGGSPPGGGGGGCYGQWDVPYYSLIYRAPNGSISTYQHYCCSSTANSMKSQLERQYRGYTFGVQKNYYRWNSCSANQLACFNGVATLVRNGSASVPVGCP